MARKQKRFIVILITISFLYLISNISPSPKPIQNESQQNLSSLLKPIDDNEYNLPISEIFLRTTSPDLVSSLPVDQRCDLFFDFLTSRNEHWHFDPMVDYRVDFRHQDYIEYFKSNGVRLNDEFKRTEGKRFKNQDEFREGLDNYMKTMYYKEKVLLNEYDMINKVSIFRIFNKCYLRDSGFMNRGYSKKVNPKSLETKVYMWLTKRFPSFENWNGDVHVPKTSTKDLFLNQVRKKSSGKGIVLTISDDHVSDTVNLIRVLRALNNKLPIEIIYNTRLSPASKQKIVECSRMPFESYPKQQVTFVNIHDTIERNYINRFIKFDFKFLAMLFTSFEDFIFLDADTVLFKSPEYFFNLQGYKQTGAYFFKDRGMLLYHPPKDIDLFREFGASEIESSMFDIPMMSNFTTNREFFRGLVHYMESGLVVMNKKRHFTSLLMAIEMNFFHPIRMKVFGDKELYWLGFAINGDENYHFNQNFAAAVGQLTPSKDRIRSDGKPYQAQEICSPHPGHLSDDDNRTLLWINSGVVFCNKGNNVDYEKEANFEDQDILKFLHTPDEFKAFYESPLVITHAIIPPLSDDLKPRYNINEEPSDGWSWKRNYCHEYMWCGYSSIGGDQTYEPVSDNGDDEENSLQGRLVTYTDEEIQFFNKLSKIWVG
ncbi:MNN13 putative alpha-1 [Candida maltosa Xu316]